MSKGKRPPISLPSLVPGWKSSAIFEGNEKLFFATSNSAYHGICCLPKSPATPAYFFEYVRVPTPVSRV
jgi:hypothetical protein